MEFRVLGPLEVRDDAGNVVPVPGARERRLLVVLLLGGIAGATIANAVNIKRQAYRFRFFQIADAIAPCLALGIAVGRIGDLIIVTRGLEGGERVIVEGLQKVRPGMQVKPEAAPAGTPPAAGAATPGSAPSTAPAAGAGAPPTTPPKAPAANPQGGG